MKYPPRSTAYRASAAFASKQHSLNMPLAPSSGVRRGDVGTGLMTSGLLALAAVAIHGCGSVKPERPQPSPIAPGRLVVKKAMPDGVMFIEGSLTQVRLTAENRVLYTGLKAIDGPKDALIRRNLAPGSYHLSTVERPCSGNCDFLDEPLESTRCQLDFTVDPQRTTTIRLTIERGALRPAIARCAVVGS